jgi:hypothetical protein
MDVAIVLRGTARSVRTLASMVSNAGIWLETFPVLQNFG